MSRLRSAIPTIRSAGHDDAQQGESLYSPVRKGADGSVTVELGESHPGFADPAYRARRDAIASLSIDHERGEPIPNVEYSEIEHDVWRIVSRELAEKHRRYATRSYLEGVDALALPGDHIPQLDDVTARLAPISGFTYEPIAGLAPLRTFYNRSTTTCSIRRSTSGITRRRSTRPSPTSFTR
jgi:hypothetical protein